MKHRALRHGIMSAAFAARQPAVRILGLVAASAIVVVVALWAIYWRPAYRTTEALRVQVDAARRDTVKALQDIELERVYRAAAKDVPRIEAKLNVGGGQAALVQQIAQLANKHQIKVLGETYDEGKINEGYVPLRLELNLQGHYLGIRNFLANLSELPHWVSVQEAVLTRGDSGDIKAQLRLLTFRRGAGRD